MRQFPPSHAGPVHRLPAGAKMAVAVGIVLAALAVPMDRPQLLAGLAAAMLAVAVAARLRWRFILGRLLLVEPLVLTVAALALFQPDGVQRFVWLVARSSVCLLAVIVLAGTTPFERQIEVLRRLRVPGILVTTIALMYRYLHVLVDESQRMQRARAARTLRRSRRLEWRSLAGLAGNLFLRSLDRAERIHAAMCARGWR